MSVVDFNDYDLESMTEQELADLSARIPDEVFLSALAYYSVQFKADNLWQKLCDTCKAYNIDTELALLAVSAIEQSNINELNEGAI